MAQNTATQKDLARVVADDLGVPAAKASKVVNLVLGKIADWIEEGTSFRSPRLNLKSIDVPARTVTKDDGTEKDVPARKAVRGLVRKARQQKKAREKARGGRRRRNED